MPTYYCRDCEKQVNRGEAHVRSVNFEQVAYCHACWDVRNGSAVVPEQRPAFDDARNPVHH